MAGVLTRRRVTVVGAHNGSGNTNDQWFLTYGGVGHVSHGHGSDVSGGGSGGFEGGRKQAGTH